MTQLTDYVSSKSAYQCNSSSSNIAKTLASTTGWNNSDVTCAVGNNPSNNNTTGFSAMPAGGYFYGNYQAFGLRSYYWSTTTPYNSGAWVRILDSEAYIVIRFNATTSNGSSVRCVRNPQDTITFMPNGATGGAMDEQVVFRGEATALNANGFDHNTVDTNWVFIGWNTSANDGVVYAPGANITTNGRITLYAQWHTWCDGTAITGEMGSTGRVDSVKDADNNWYKVVQIGEQCWLKENMKTTKFADGTVITSSVYTSSTTAYWYNTKLMSPNKKLYGLLYNWPAVMHGAASSSANPSGVQGICPNGWHVPSNAEFTQLTNYVNQQSQYKCNGESGNITKALASTYTWKNNSDAGTCSISRDSNANNKTGFSVRGAGYFRYYNSSSTYYNSEEYTCLGSSTENSSNFNVLMFRYFDKSFSTFTLDKASGVSVRCVRNVIITDTITFMPNGATGGAMEKQVVSRGVATTLNANGFNHNQNHHPEDTNWVFIGWNTSGYDSVAYAPGAKITTNGNDTLYAQWHTWCIGNALTGEMGTGRVDSVKDYENNWYKVVQIGNQCWLKENLKTTHYANGETISGPTYDPSESTAYWGYPCFQNDSTKKDFYGLLYNWTAIMDSAESSSAYPSGVQGICPTGWHVPSKAEIDTMYLYVQRQPQYVTQNCSNAITCDNNYCYFCIAKSLATTVSWDSVSYRIDDYCVGDATYYNNRTGLSYVPNMNMSTDCWIFSSQSNDNGRNAIFTGVGSEKSYAYCEPTYIDQYAGARCVRNILKDTITFMPNGATGGTMSQQVVTRGTAAALSANEFTHTAPDANWAFIGWNTDALGNGTSYAAGANITTNGNDTLYAQWHTWCNGTAIDGESGSAGRVDSVKDADNNWYKVVQIGEQCWLKENLKTTKYHDGTDILSTSPSTATSTTTAYWYYPNNSSSNKKVYGLLYNWPAVTRGDTSSSNPSGVQGVCPTGWHVPSDPEFTQLTNYVTIQSEYVCGTNSTYIAKALASTTLWNSSNTSCNVGKTPSANNTTGFTAVPADKYNNGSSNFGKYAHFWSATQESSNRAFFEKLASNSKKMESNYSNMYDGFSVRCVRDLPVKDTITFMPNGATGGTMEKQVVTRGEATALNANGFTLTGSLFQGWNTDTTGTGTHYADGATIITNGNMTLYAEWFTTCGTDKAYDIDNNAYHTVQIDNQCWLKENLRTTRYANGNTIAGPATETSTTSAWYYPNNNSSNKEVYGLLYNWSAVMNGSPLSGDNLSGVQGICPTGWHVPSDNEWLQMTSYVSSLHKCDGENEIAKALASTTGWNSSTEDCTAGNNPNNNNATGFSAVPAGYYDGGYEDFGNRASFWSATQEDASNASCRYLNHDDKYVYSHDDAKINGFSVRCLRD